MRHTHEETGRRGEATGSRVGRQTNYTTQRTTQLDRVLSMLLEADEVCGSEFYRQYIPRFSVWVHKLRKAGYVVSKRRCDRHNHEGVGWLYRLEALPHPPSEVGR